MTRGYAANNQTEIAKDALLAVYFVEALFKHATNPDEYVRAWSGPHETTWNSSTWTAVGDLIGVSQIEEMVDLSSPKTKITLNGVNTSLLGYATSWRYQSQPIKVWVAFLNPDTYERVAEPELHHDGLMDTMDVVVEGEVSIIEITSESRAFRLRIPSMTRYTDADQQGRYSGDLAFEYVEDINQGYELLWGRGGNSFKGDGATAGDAGSGVAKSSPV